MASGFQTPRKSPEEVQAQAARAMVPPGTPDGPAIRKENAFWEAEAAAAAASASEEASAPVEAPAEAPALPLFLSHRILFPTARE